MSITIITAVKNGSQTIRGCIESILMQSYQGIEYIVIDGGSTDGTLELLQRYKNRIAKTISEPDYGIYDALNKGITLASGDIVGFLHSDDFYVHGNVLKRVVDVFEKNNIASCYGDLIYVHTKDTERVIRYWRSGPYDFRRFCWGWMPPHPTFFVSREIYEKYGLYNLALGTAADYELMLRFLFRHKITATYIPEILVKMRIGGISNISLKNRFLANRFDRLAWRVNGLKPYPCTLYLKPLRKIFQYVSRP